MPVERTPPAEPRRRRPPTRTITRRRTVDRDGLSELLTPRDDIVGEEPLGDGRFGLVDGPFLEYERQVEVLEPAPGPRADGDRAHADRADGDRADANRADGDRADGIIVQETFRYRMPAGLWRPIVGPFVARGLRRRPEPGKTPLWAPPQRPDVQGTVVLMVLATLALVVGYHGTLLGQTMTFAAEEFGADKDAQGVALAVARIGGVLAIVLGALADRRGRRLMLMASLFGCIGSTALGAITPNLMGLAVTQSVNRGTWAAAVLLLGVIVAEEMPAGARAYALGLLTMCVAVGAGLALALLPVADVAPHAWRLLYAAPLTMVPVVWHYGRRLPESRRYVRPHRNLSLHGHMHHLVMICVAIFLLNMFLGPAPQFRNEFLRDERDFSAAGLSLFAVLTSTPGSIGILVGGRLAETVGRRWVAAVSGITGAALVALSFIVQGPSMWMAATIGTISMAALAPSFTVYNAELFPTSLRGRTSGIISMVAMGGSVVGLLAAGAMATAFGSFGPAMAVLALGPCLMALIVLARYPETKYRELEELNPEDAVVPDDGQPAPPPPVRPGPPAEQ